MFNVKKPTKTLMLDAAVETLSQGFIQQQLQSWLSTTHAR